ncbi:MAG: hydrocarbon degradation protein [Flavobacteriales bacterium]|nr:hydrocarbon degradation protein [Flavobacteriales bacterium]|tara:strand:- start:29407 stop:30621 length:1215 start_codon:yes stop_codon:yes gene_type:complete
MKKILLGILGFGPLLMHAGGFQVNLQGTKQTGMGHLGTSFYLGASSAYFNPAMMGFSESKFNFEAGVSPLLAYAAYQNQETGRVERTDNPLGTPFYFYGTYKINDELSAGLAVYTPFGSSVVWGDDWSGRNLIQDISLQAIFFQPTVSYKISEKLNVGLGLIYATGAVEINRAIPAPIGENNSVNLKGNTASYGYNFGIHYQATEKLTVGVTYRSEIEMELEGGDADFSVDPALRSNFPDTKFDATLPLPSTTTLGIAYQASEKLLLSVEGSLVGWSTYESLDFDFEDNTESLEDSENPRNYEDAIIVRAGAQYSVNDKLDARLGVYYDQSPVTDEYFNPETPSTDNLGITAGLSYSVSEKFTVDASFLYIYGMERESEYKPANFGGKYQSRSYIPGIGLNYKF